MVPGTLGKQVVYVLVSIGLVVALGLLAYTQRDATVENPAYSATDDAIDLAVVGGITAADRSLPQGSTAAVKAVVVPHHLVASRSIALGIKSLASSTPRLIVVISPDHYNRCPKLLCTTRGSYKSFFGNTDISQAAVTQLEKSDLVAESGLFSKEHGIYAVVPFIKHYIPDAQILPIAVSQKGRGSEQDRAKIIELLKPFLSRKDAALVISSDFSHYLPLAESNQMDAKTQNSFCSGNSGEILNLQNPSQSDCPLCLWILEQEAQELGFWNPDLVAHTNSADLLHDTSAKETTSHFVFALSALPTQGNCLSSPGGGYSSEVKVLFVGDMMFDRYIRQVNNKHGEDFFFSCIDPLLQSADFVLGNLEGPITAYPSVSLGTTSNSPGHYRFTFPTTTAEALFRHNIRVVSIGNNHISNYGSEGIASTHKYLSEAGVAYFGGLAGDSPVYRTTRQGIDLSFVNYNQFGGDPAEKVAKVIAAEHAAGRTVIVYTHWGEEYVEPPATVRDVAALFAENGADLIVGSHPHIIQAHEMIGSTPVYYSLGNFIFDQYWEPNATKGLALLARISKNKIAIEEKPVTLNPDGRTCPL